MDKTKLSLGQFLVRVVVGITILVTLCLPFSHLSTPFSRQVGEAILSFFIIALITAICLHVSPGQSSRASITVAGIGVVFISIDILDTIRHSHSLGDVGNVALISAVSLTLETLVCLWLLQRYDSSGC
jgi:hypothetical protein